MKIKFTINVDSNGLSVLKLIFLNDKVLSEVLVNVYSNIYMGARNALILHSYLKGSLGIILYFLINGFISPRVWVYYNALLTL